mgnify:FL=1
MGKYLELKEKIFERIDANWAELIALNDDLADHPEISGQEFETSRKIVELLKKKGFATEYPFAGIETAFKAVYGPNNHKYKVAILTEYDALPDIGHACGHCVSGSISVLAGIAMAELQDELNADIHVIGTPIEEADGAKVQMTDDGVFNDYDMAIMIHLYDQNLLYCILNGLMSYQYNFHGKTAHASAAPWEGKNALNAAQLMFHGIDMLRQHVTPDVRMHGIYKKAGVVPNIVPEEASVHFYMRAVDKAYLQEVHRMVDDCARGAAIMTQTTWDTFKVDATYDCMKNNPAGISVMKEVYKELGIDINGDHDKIFGPSDIGNVSFACPAFHPTLQIVDRGVAIHTREFADAVKTQRAHDAIKLGAEVISLHITKTFMDEDKIKAMKEDFNK